MPKSKPFIEGPQESLDGIITDQPKRRPDLSRVVVPLNEDGSVNLSGMRDSTRQRLEKALSSTPDLQGKNEPQPDTFNVVTPEHVKMILDVFSGVEQYAVPRYLNHKIAKAIEKQTGRKALENEVVQYAIDPRAVQRALTYTELQKDRLAPVGALALNTHLPDWAKQWIANVGPGAEFIAAFVLIEKEKFANLIALDRMYKEERKQQEQPAPSQSGVTKAASEGVQ